MKSDGQSMVNFNDGSRIKIQVNSGNIHLFCFVSFPKLNSSYGDKNLTHLSEYIAVYNVN